MNACILVSILVLCSSFKNIQKRGTLFVCGSHIHFSFSALYYPHALGFSTYVYTGEGVEELCTCI